MDALKQLQAVRHLRDDYALFKKQHPENPAEVNLYAEIEAAFDEMFKCLDKV